MCTLALFSRVFDDCPLLVAANRDEHYDRPAVAPACMGDAPKILAGKDLRAGGTWLGANERGLVVGVLNRRGEASAPVRAHVRSRGLLCMDLLKLESVAEAREFLRRHKSVYSPFTVVYADAIGAGVAFNHHPAEITVASLDPGLHVFSSAALVGTISGKADRAYARFLSWSGDHPLKKDKAVWLAGLRSILSDHTTDRDPDSREAICVHGAASGTVSSTVIRHLAAKRRVESHYCSGAPCQNQFAAPVTLDLAR